MHYHNDRSTIKNIGLAWAPVVLFFSLNCQGPPDAEAASADRDHRVEVKIDKQVISRVVPAGSLVDRAMLGIARHPDGTIFVNTQNGPLYKSNDRGQTWTAVTVKLPDAPPRQRLHGFHINPDGRMWLMHQSSAADTDCYVSHSTDKARTWKTTPIDFTTLPPGGPQRPYNRCYNDHSSFIERPDGTMIVKIGARREPSYWLNPENLDPATGLVRPDAEIGGCVLLRSSDGGKTWGDATLAHPYMSEVSLAVDPRDPDHILAMTRLQRPLLAGEDREATIKKTGCPADMDPRTPAIYKNGMLLESNDGARSLFREVPGGITGYYEHRGTILWTKNDVIVVNHQDRSGRVVVRISLDGGKKWVDGTNAGTTLMNRSTKFILVPNPPGHSFTSPSVELSPNHFLTVFTHGNLSKKIVIVSGVFWHLE